MTTIVISTSGQYPFGNMTNQAVASIVSLTAKIERIRDAIVTASSGYTGVEGTQFEIPVAGAQPVTPGTPANLFGVSPSATPGEQGAAYRYAMEGLAAEWTKFWQAAAPFVEALDNGNTSM